MKIKSLRLGCLALGLASLAFFEIANSAAQDPQNSNTARPRRVSSQPAQSNTNSQPQTNNNTEEVDEGDVVRVETQLVTVPAVVSDKNGRPLVTLKRENFVVLEDGKPQQLANFATTETPFEIALLLDT